ncbi:MAG: TenA family protein [Synechococcales bacterium]|nr:TenA family protein [Synechococcales bacterium]
MISQQLWQDNQDLAIACLETPFVQGIGDGSLSRQRFAHYVGQDAFFLEAFARAYSIAAAKAPDWESFQIFHRLAAGVLEELNLHQGYAAGWGVNIQSVVPDAATRRYTDFLLATAWSQSVGVTTAAMLPCMRLYAALGKELAQNGIPNHDYHDWIATYSGNEFDQLAQQLADLGDRYADLSPAVHHTYRYAMECELAFFQSAWELGAG